MVIGQVTVGLVRGGDPKEGCGCAEANSRLRRVHWRLGQMGPGQVDREWSHQEWQGEGAKVVWGTREGQLGAVWRMRVRVGSQHGMSRRWSPHSSMGKCDGV